MAITTAVMSTIAAALTGNTFTTFDGTHTYMGIGDSSTAFNAAQTDLQASTNKQRKQADASYPQVSGAAVTIYATFGTSDANFAWNEWGTFNAASGGTMLNRSVTFTGGSPGTKPNTQTWQLQVGLTFQAA